MKISLALLMLFIIAVPTLNPLVEGKSLEVKNSKEYVQIEVVEYKETKPVHKKTVSIEKEKAEWLFEELSKTRTPAAQISILRSYRLISGETEKLKQDAIGYAKKLGLVNSEGENVINRDKGLMILGYIAAIGNGTVFLAKGSIDGIPRLHLLLYWRLWDALFSAAGILGRVVYREGCISRGMVLGFFGYGTYIKNPPVNWKERTGVVIGFFAALKYSIQDMKDMERDLDNVKTAELDLKKMWDSREEYSFTILKNKIILNPYATNSFYINPWFNCKSDTI